MKKVGHIAAITGPSFLKTLSLSKLEEEAMKEEGIPFCMTQFFQDLRIMGTHMVQGQNLLNVNISRNLDHIGVIFQQREY